MVVTDMLQGCKKGGQNEQRQCDGEGGEWQQWKERNGHAGAERERDDPLLAGDDRYNHGGEALIDDTISSEQR